ncbi:MAG TPA: endonuclease/exonuclease/phosphatase family protein [Saprospiraceae bacterium]|nr:endonuclease/exonuclease/phosphatase family protein [Saprospiraceae bacterium]
MKLISWNCQGAFRKKADYILDLKPDILVVQECEHPDKLDFSKISQQPNDSYWYGDNVHKGIGIYSFSDFKFELLEEFNPKFRYILPFRVTGKKESFLLFAIWAMDNKENRKERYVGQIWLAIHHYLKMFAEPTILVGDFNSNKIWDHKDRNGNHSDVVNKLAEHNIHSIYHRHSGCEQGNEKHPTFYLHRNLQKPYHLDYCFASTSFLDKLIEIEIGNYENWTAYSDHTPVMVSFEKK